MQDSLTVGEVARLAGVSVKTVRRAVACGELPCLRFNARVHRVRRCDFDRWFLGRLSTTGNK